MPASFYTEDAPHILKLPASPPDKHNGPTTWRTTEQGAATSVFVATSPLFWKASAAATVQDSNEAVQIDATTDSIVDEAGEPGGVATHALDTEAAARLGDLSIESLGI